MQSDINKTKHSGDRRAEQSLPESSEADVLVAAAMPPSLRKVPDLRGLQAYLDGRADADTAAAVEAALADPGSPLSLGLGDALARRDDAGPHGDWYNRMADRAREIGGDGPA